MAALKFYSELFMSLNSEMVKCIHFAKYLIITLIYHNVLELECSSEAHSYNKLKW